MTTHTWNSNATGQLYDPTNYVDGQPFVPGDTLVFDGGTGLWTGALATGTYLFNGSSGSNSLSLFDATLDGSSTIAESGTSQFLINSFGQFVNDGTLEAGTAAASGPMELISNVNGTEAASVTNNGQIIVQNGSVFQLFPLDQTSFVNSASGTITVTTGGSFGISDLYGYEPADGDSLVNNGLISVTAPDGRGSTVTIGAAYSGSGTLSVQGTPGSNPFNTIAEFEGPASGNFDVASGQLEFEDSPVQGTINFLDDDGFLNLTGGPADMGPLPYLPLQATVNHFEAGDQIYLQDNGTAFQADTCIYDQTSHVLDLYTEGQMDGQIPLAGEYTTSDFQITTTEFQTDTISTTNSLNGTQTVAPGGSFSGDNGNPIIDTQGNATVTTGTGASTVNLAGGDNYVQANGNDTILSSSGNDTVSASSAVLDVAGSSGALTFFSSGGSTVSGSGAAMTVFGGSGGGDVVYGGTGLAEFIGGSGSSDFVGGQGAEIVFGGTGGGSISGGAAGGFIYGGDAATTISGGAGNSTITAANGNTVLLNGAASNLVAAGGGNVTLVGGGSTGNNSVFGGSGTDLLAGGAGDDYFMAGTGAATMTGGGGTNLYAFQDGSAGGSTVITDFQTGADHLTLQGYGSNAVAAALGSATVVGGSTLLALQDGTHITLTGVTNLTAASFT